MIIVSSSMIIIVDSCCRKIEDLVFFLGCLGTKGVLATRKLTFLMDPRDKPLYIFHLPRLLGMVSHPKIYIMIFHLLSTELFLLGSREPWPLASFQPLLSTYPSRLGGAKAFGGSQGQEVGE